MENQKYLSEEKYQQNNAKVKKVGKMLLIIGIIILLIGIVFVIIGFNSTGNTAANVLNSFDSDITTGNIQNTINGVFGNFGLFTIGGFLNTIGFILAGIGGILLLTAHRREIVAYTAQQMIPVGKEIVEEVAPTIGNAAGTIAKSIAKGIKDGNNDGNQ